MTPEQIQSALDSFNNGYEGDPDFFEFVHGKTIRHALTQALEIAKGDKVVVPREPTDEIIDAILDTGLVYADANDCGSMKAFKIYKAMIAVAEGE